ncbi:MAG: flagellar filament capping protein FliD [Campylobacterales bacterium]|nr:flagellar filament capping protein FliD [Campylobacterales bacterium]
MATGALSSLGIGSSVLTYEVIEKLRGVDEKAKITPIDNKLEENLTQQKDLTAITGYLNSLKSAASALSSDLLFQGRNVKTSGTSATLTADAGVLTQEIAIDVTKLAAKDIFQTVGKASQTSTFGSSNDTLGLTIDGKTYSIDVKTTTTLTELAEAINNSTDGKIEARIMNVGGENPYRLIIQSAKTGDNQKIEFSGNTVLTDLGLNHADAVGAEGTSRLSSAGNAIFTYNGINMQRETNTVDNITVGLTLKLTEIGKTTFNVTQDTDALIDEMNHFVTAYNDLVNNLAVATDYDSESKKSGSLQGNSQINAIKTVLNRLLTSMDSDGRSLDQYGLGLNDSGLLQLTESTLREKLTNNALDVESFFKGMSTPNTTIYTPKNSVSADALDLKYGDLTINGTAIIFTTPGGSAEDNALALRDAINKALVADGITASLDSLGTKVILSQKDGWDISVKGNAAGLNAVGYTARTVTGSSESNEGIFSQLNQSIENMVSKDKGSITLLGEQFTNAQTRLSKEKERTMGQLDSKYATMVAQFAAYDTMIANLNNQFATLQSMIDAQLKSK